MTFRNKEHEQTGHAAECNLLLPVYVSKMKNVHVHITIIKRKGGENE